jgi:hypothetical protein
MKFMQCFEIAAHDKRASPPVAGSRREHHTMRIVMTMHFPAVLGIAGAVCLPLASAGAQAAPANSRATTTYVAELHALNTKATGMHTAGEARFTIAGDSLTISVTARHVPPDMMHLQHFHGFTTSQNATCPTAAADANHDGVIDLIETEPTSGTTMVPFTGDPVSMEIVTDSYPKASADGTYQYRKTVSLSALEAAFAKAFDGQKLDLARRVVIIHGVPSTTTLPASAASLGKIPAQVTVPIACGKIVLRGK